MRSRIEGGTLAERLVGAWRLESMEAHGPAGLEHPWGSEIDGQLLYERGGHMSLQMARIGRAFFAAGDRERGSDAEIGAAFAGYHAYFGRYTVDEAAQVVVHHVGRSLFPNWEGGSQRRLVEVAGETLILTSEPIPFGASTQRFVTRWTCLV